MGKHKSDSTFFILMVAALIIAVWMFVIIAALIWLPFGIFGWFYRLGEDLAVRFEDQINRILQRTFKR